MNIGDGGKKRESKKITEDAEDKLVDTNIEGYFGNYMIASIDELH